MGTITEPKPVKLIIGFLAKNESMLGDARKRAAELYGTEEHSMGPIPFTWTNYYEKELGDSPLKLLVSYETLIKREELVTIKLQTNELEKTFSENGLRLVNLDPGYMTLGQFFLASTKDQRQRVYAGQGIFVETTLYFKNGNFKPFEWTYRDYQSPQYLQFFSEVRSKLVYQIKKDHL